MRIAVLSDVHANLEALVAVLDRTRALKAEEIVCLGDIVGYNANPNECIDILRSEHATCILGNHDAAAAGLEEPESFNPLARAAVLWTRERLTDESRQFLAGLPREKRVHDFFLFHGSIHDTGHYLFYRDDAVDNFRLLAGLPKGPRIGFFGHTHLAAVLSEQQGGIISVLLDREEVNLIFDKRYLINPGSVGQPRDGDPRASFLIYDDQERRVTFLRTAYDIGKCRDKIISAGLPPQFADRLEWGR